jgi:GT2 family glycosyltransferase
VTGLLRQSTPATEILLCIASPADCLPETASLPSVRVITGPRGSTLQRNCILDALRNDCDIVAFLDDDLELDPHYLENAIQFMSNHPDVVAFSGEAVADGAETGEIHRDIAITLIAENPPAPEIKVQERNGLWGCSFVRANVARTVRFDQRMSLYALFEDLDFGERCKQHGRVVSVSCCRLVHLAVTSGRVSARRMGYAQITNPLYLLHKRSVPGKCLFRLLANVILANLAGLVIHHKGKGRRQRLGQLGGNIIAVLDYLRYGAQPERVARIS